LEAGVLIVMLMDWNAGARGYKRRMAWMQYAVYGIMALILWNGIQTANAAYAKTDLEWQATLFNMTKINADIHEMGYVDSETKVHFHGIPQTGCDDFEYLKNIHLPDYDSKMSFAETVGAYYRYVFQPPILILYEYDANKEAH